MAEIKTQPNSESVEKYIEKITPEKKQTQTRELLKLFERVTNCPAVMWGSAIIGFDSYQYTNSCGTNDWMITGFAARKQNFALYIIQGFENYKKELQELGKIKTAKSCLYINKLEDIDIEKLENFLHKTVSDMRKKHNVPDK